MLHEADSFDCANQKGAHGLHPLYLSPIDQPRESLPGNFAQCTHVSVRVTAFRPNSCIADYSIVVRAIKVLHHSDRILEQNTQVSL